MKTAMQELLELCKHYQATFQNPIGEIVKKIEGEFLEKEKLQMCQFQEDGQSTDFWVKYDDWEDCFDKTFNTNKQ